MKKLNKLFISLVFFSIFYTFNNTQAENFINIYTFTLDNGITVAVIPQKRVPVITHMLWYNVGSNDEPFGKSGLAHFNEHLMFRGSKNIPDGEFSKIIAQNGGEDNAFTSRNYTAYHQTIAANRLELVMAMEADRMHGLEITPTVFATEHKVIIEERLTSYENSPARLLSERMRLALWPNDNNGISIIGHMNEIKNITIEDVIDFHQNWYTPANAYVVIAGDIDKKTAEKLTKKYYGKIKTYQSPPKKTYSLPPEKLSAQIILPHEQVFQHSMQKYYAVPQETKDNETFILSLELLSEILGNPNVGRLFRSLVQKQKMAGSVGCYYDSMANYPNIFGFYGYPRDEQISLERLEAAIDEEINKIANGDLNNDDLENAKNRIIANIVYLKDSTEDMAKLVGEILVTGRNLDIINTYPDKLKAITASDVITAALFLKNHSAKVSGFLVPSKKEPTP